MSNYEPQVGARVRRTYPDGTIVEGVIARVGNGWGDSEGGFTLYSNAFHEQTELLERPFKLNTEPGAVYGSPANPFYRVVRFGPDDTLPWLGYSGRSVSWFTHKEVELFVRHSGWVEYNLDGSRKND